MTRIVQLDFCTSRLAMAATTAIAAMPLLFTAPSAAAPSAQLLPHRAIYEMTLDNNASGGSIGNIVGRMVFEIKGSRCEGFTQTMRMVTRVTPQKGAPRTTDIRTSSWEAADGKQFRFDSKQYMNQKLSEKSAGTATRKSDATPGSGVDIQITVPNQRKIAVDGPIMFPAQHSLAILKAASDGKRSVFTRIYDGSEQGAKAYETNTFIGKAENGTAPLPRSMETNIGGATALKGRTSWPVIMSFYEIGGDKNDAPPIYEMAFRYFDNGVSTDLRIDYGKFALKGRLSKLETIEQAACDQ